ncbi:arginase [Coprinopsis cinerea AmutBmut pab1-1]|nr:arginase [Coprinopsis cinerea AmutBmut pab1-1]
MGNMKTVTLFLSLISSTFTLVGAQAQEPTTWFEKYGPQLDLSYTGPLSFAHLPYRLCLQENATFDVAILGMPFDTAVSYRPGARFGPSAIRSGSRRQSDVLAYSLSWGFNPYTQGYSILDCGDVPVNSFDNTLALDQMEVAYSTLLRRPIAREDTLAGPLKGKDGLVHPRVVSLGGDHTIVLPILRSLYKVYGPITVIHFDAHLDTWPTLQLSGIDTEQSRITHGSFFYVAHEEGLLANNSIHGGIRTPLSGPEDLANDSVVGFQVITSDDIDSLGIPEIVRKMRARVGDSPVYLSVDIDVIDPGMAPATGTPEAGGWTTREFKRILRGLKGLNFIGADLVEVSPAYDQAEITGIAAASVVHDLLSLLVTSNGASK